MIAIGSPARPETERLWAITTYFNPMRYQRRLLNYRLFRELLNLPLVAVELAYGPDFELTEDDADILVQLRGKDVLWQKERLLNVALRALPPTCRKVVYLDCDIIFEADDWSDQVSRLLDRVWTVQLFSHAHYLRSDWTPDVSPIDGVEFTRTAIVCAVASGVPVLSCFRQPSDPRQASYSKGHAWAMRRELLEQHGFYDGCIVGGGDRAMAAACYGVFNEVVRQQCMNERQRTRYLAWAKPFHAIVRAELAFVEGNLFHLWHGELSNRYTGRRHQGLKPFDFDPFTDIAIDHGGCWRWNTDKPQMHDYVRGYFASRKEDG